MKKIYSALFAVIVLALAGGIIWIPAMSGVAGEAPPRELLKLYGGLKGFVVLHTPERVEAFRLSHTTGEEPTVTAGPVKVDQKVVKQLVSALSARQSYGWEYGKGCIPVWGVRLSFYRHNDRIDILLCFDCDILRVSLNGKPIEHEDFDPIRPQLVRAMKAIFPNDPVVQNLPEVS